MKKLNKTSKVEKRRLAFEKRNVKKEQNLANYGAEGGSALVMAKTIAFNRRVIAAVLALVFVLTTVIVGFNIATKAEEDTDGYTMFEAEEESGLVLRKGYKYDEATGEYSLKMEAYVTDPIAEKVIDNDVPLDIVFVLDQTNSMNTKDVLTGGYDPIDKPFSIEEAEDKYYKVTDNDGDHYYKVFSERSTKQEDYVVIKNDEGDDIEGWTAVDANNKYNELGQSIYRKNSDNSYDEVFVSKENWYKNAGPSVPLDKFINAGLIAIGDWGYKYDHGDIAEFYYNSAGSFDDYEPSWHRVHENSKGVLGGGYYIHLWYHTTARDGSSLNSATSFERELQKGNVAFVPNSRAYPEYGSSDGAYDAWYKDSWARDRTSPATSSQPYVGEQLYEYNELTNADKQNENVPYNNMYVIKRDGTPETLAWPVPATTKYDLNSRVYPGKLHTAGYKLYYYDDNQVKHEVDNCTSVYAKSETSYTGTLYEMQTITRLEAQKTATNNLATQIATVMGDRDYRIAVVGSANNGTIYSGNQTANGAYVNNASDATTAINTATNDTANGTTIADGLTEAQEVFAANKINPADSRKRIVIVFGDNDTWENNDSDETRQADAELKDTSNASVYAIGLFQTSPDAHTEQFMKEVSSEYFSMTAAWNSPILVEDIANGGKPYHYVSYGSVFPDVSGSIYEKTETVGNAIPSATTKVVLGTANDVSNSILKDIISSNFIVPDEPDIDVDTATKTNSDDGYVWTEDRDPALSGEEPYYSWSKTDRTLTVEGFDYNANYVTDTNDGKKIIVTISGLQLKDKAAERIKTDSDKRIYFNDPSSGIYKTGLEELLMAKFPRPYVDNKTQLAPAGGSGLPDADSGIVVNKYLSPNANGNYDLTIEAYTTQTSSEKTEKIPTDFIVVADQSGSMRTKDMATSYTDAGATYLETIAEDAALDEPDGYYYYDETTQNYYRVYPVKSYLYEYFAPETKWTKNILDDAGMDLSWFQGETEAEYSKANQYYYKTPDNVYRPIKVTSTGKIGAYYIKFSYVDANGQEVYFVRPNKPVYKNVFGSDSSKYGPGSFMYGAVNAAVLAAYPTTTAYTYSEFLGITTGMYINQPMYKRHVGYTELRYRDVNGVEHTVSASNGNNSWEYCNSSGQAKTTASGSTRPTYTNLYKGSGKITRLQALKNALTEFATAVANEEDDFHKPVDNRIALVGFSSDGFSNTEILTKTDQNLPSTTNGWQKSDADRNKKEYYGKALVDSTNGTTGDVNNKISAAINALTANGGTQPEDGLEMAYEILRNRDKTTYTTSSTNETVDRNVFVIFFTDGHPGDYDYSDMYSEANQVVEEAKLIKDYRVDHTDIPVADDDIVIPSLFSIGVFGESDGNPLTYHAHTDRTDKNYDYLFESGHMDVYEAGWSTYYYLNRNWIASNPTEYGSTANDTIFDYMSVVSSNYPDATKYMNVTGSGVADKGSYPTYIDMVNGVRNSSTASNMNKYYRMASNQETLVAAFQQAVSRATQSISADQRLDANSVMKDVFKNTNFVTSEDTSYSFATVVGSMDKNGVVSFKEDSKETVYLPYDLDTDENNNTYIDVTGFDYLANYINYRTTNPDSTISNIPHDGKKLVTTITNVVPTGKTGDNLESNISPTSSMYIGTNTAGEAFPTPAITSYKYTLDVGDVNRNATFDVTATIWNPSVGTDGVAVDKDSDMLEDVIVVYPNGERHLYSEVGAQTFYNMKNGQGFYFENLPSSYQIRTDVVSTDNAYEYKIYYDNDESDEKPMTKGRPETKKFTYDDHVINIVSTRGEKPVSIREETVGTYADMTLEFGEAITMEIPVVAGEDHDGPFKYDCTFDTYHNFSDSTIPEGATYKAVFQKVGEVDGVITAKLTGFEWTKNGISGGWDLSDDVFPMQTGDEITITVKGGDTVKVNEVVTHDYGVTYYSGQDDVAPSDIKLKAADGSLLDGEYEITLIPIDGTNGSNKTLSFRDGILIGENKPIDLAPYQSISSPVDLSEAVFDISGKSFDFDYETDGENEAYVATIRDITDEPPVSAIVEKNKMDILVVNRMGDIPIESVYDNGHHHIVLYILSAIGVLTLATGGYYVYRKKDEFINE